MTRAAFAFDTYAKLRDIDFVSSGVRDKAAAFVEGFMALSKIDVIYS